MTNTKLAVALFLLTSASALAEAPDLSSSLEALGNPLVTAFPNAGGARVPYTMKAFDGKVFTGGGDMGSNSGPVPMYVWYPSRGEFVHETTIQEESVNNLHIFSDGNLYTPGEDPRDAYQSLRFHRRHPGSAEWETVEISTQSIGIHNEAMCEAPRGRIWNNGYGYAFGDSYGAAGWSVYPNEDPGVYGSSYTTGANSVFEARNGNFIGFENVMHAFIGVAAAYRNYSQSYYSGQSTAASTDVTRFSLFQTIYQSASNTISIAINIWTDVAPGLAAQDFPKYCDGIASGEICGYFFPKAVDRPLFGRTLYTSQRATDFYGNGDIISAAFSGVATGAVIKATRMTGIAQGEEYVGDMFVPLDEDAGYALTLDYDGAAKDIKYTVKRTTDALAFEDLFSITSCEDLRCFSYEDGWWYFASQGTPSYPFVTNSLAESTKGKGTLFRLWYPKEPVQIVAATGTNAVDVAEGSSTTLSFTLSANPASTVTALVQAVDGDTLSVDKSTLTFTTSDWNTPHLVKATVTDDDGDQLPGCAVRVFTTNATATTALVPIRPVNDDTPSAFTFKKTDCQVTSATLSATVVSNAVSQGSDASTTVTVTIAAEGNESSTSQTASKTLAEGATGIFTFSGLSPSTVYAATAIAANSLNRLTTTQTVSFTTLDSPIDVRSFDVICNGAGTGATATLDLRSLSVTPATITIAINGTSVLNDANVTAAGEHRGTLSSGLAVGAVYTATATLAIDGFTGAWTNTFIARPTTSELSVTTNAPVPYAASDVLSLSTASPESGYDRIIVGQAKVFHTTEFPLIASDAVAGIAVGPSANTDHYEWFGLASGGWTELTGAGHAPNAKSVDVRIDLSVSGATVTKVAYSVGGTPLNAYSGGSASLTPYTTALPKKFTFAGLMRAESLDIYNAQSTSNSPGGSVEVVAPEIGDPGGGTGNGMTFGRDAEGNLTFTIGIKSCVENAYYTAFTTTDLNGKWTAAEGSTLATDTEGMTFDLTPQEGVSSLFVKIVASTERFDAGEELAD